MNIKTSIGLALLILVVVFIIQNTSIVNIQFLLWEVSMPRSLMIIVVLAIGVAIGWITAGHFQKRH